MANKLIIEFVNDWIRDTAGIRCRVLHNENTEMTNWGLDVSQRNALKSFDRPAVVKKIIEELLLLGIDLDDLRKSIWGLAPGDTSAVNAALYDQGRTHIRRVEPAVVTADTPTPVVLLGQGFTNNAAQIAVRCEKAGEPVQAFVPASVSCGVDVWQRVTVTVRLSPAGDWTVSAQNAGDADWSLPTGTIHVI
jgi:hypothetical protein